MVKPMNKINQTLNDHKKLSITMISILTILILCALFYAVLTYKKNKFIKNNYIDLHLRTLKGYSVEYGSAIKGGMELKINLVEDSITFSPLNKNQIEIVKNALEEKVRIDYKTVYEYYYRKQIDDEPPEYRSFNSENRDTNSEENLAIHSKLIFRRLCSFLSGSTLHNHRYNKYYHFSRK